METFNIILSIGIIILFVTTVVFLVSFKKEWVRDFVKNKGVLVAFIITLLTTLGSLSYSMIWELPPCPLCWYQRIFMFPLPLIFLVSLINREKNVWLYVTPLALLGLVISAYQSLLQTGIFGQSLFCEPGSIESCSIPEIQVFGFVTLPLMAFVSFLAISVISFISQKK